MIVGGRLFFLHLLQAVAFRQRRSADHHASLKNKRLLWKRSLLFMQMSILPVYHNFP